MSTMVWNGVYSAVFSVSNRVKQGGVTSPFMFCIYIDELLLKLADSGIACWFGKYDSMLVLLMIPCY